MFLDSPELLIYVAVGAYFVGWLAGKIGTFFGYRIKGGASDPRDHRIRSLEANERVARTEVDRTQVSLAKQSDELLEIQDMIKARDTIITDQQSNIRQLQGDLKDSVIKTRELRVELSNRAIENARSESRLRDVETELSVAQASTDMIATGVLDYSVMQEEDKN